MLSFPFLLTNLLLGIGLAMDAFAVSLANGLSEKGMRLPRMSLIAGVFGIFQAVMPMLGWLAVHTVVSRFERVSAFIPYIAFILLAYIGGKMLLEGIRGGEEEQPRGVSFSALMVQGIATSIDALSVGFTNAELSFLPALTGALIIGAVTFLICLAGLFIGKRFGTLLSGKAQILGGIILIGIGIKILLEGLL